MYEHELNYKGYRCNIFGIPASLIHKEGSYKATINRLRRDGYLLNEEGMWSITDIGKSYVKKKLNSFKQFDSPFNKNSKKNLLLAFDIPEPKKAEREWFRGHIKKYNYILIQKSIWVGPSPLPKDFTKYLKDIKLDKCIKTFKLSRPYVSK
jgi:DNA-binding transcriptional regulator PaaX